MTAALQVTKMGREIYLDWQDSLRYLYTTSSLICKKKKKKKEEKSNVDLALITSSTISRHELCLIRSLIIFCRLNLCALLPSTAKLGDVKSRVVGGVVTNGNHVNHLRS